MENRSIRYQRLIEAIEACRPGHDDLSDPGLTFLVSEMALRPELAELRKGVARIDSTVAEAFGEVAVPQGLADRILERLAVEGGSASAPMARNSEPEVQPASSGGRSTRRRWLIAGAAMLAAAGSLLVAVLMGTRQGEMLSGDTVREAANEFFRNETSALPGGQQVAVVAPPSSYPFSPDVAKVPGIRWRTVRGFLGRRGLSGVAYDLAPVGGPRATLYVVKIGYQIPKVGSTPPLKPELGTNNLCTSAWQSGPLLYVLVVEGGPQNYRGYLDLPTSPLASGRAGPASALSAKSA